MKLLDLTKWDDNLTWFDNTRIRAYQYHAWMEHGECGFFYDVHKKEVFFIICWHKDFIIKEYKPNDRKNEKWIFLNKEKKNLEAYLDTILPEIVGR